MKKEYFFRIEVAGYIQAKNKRKAYKEVKKNLQHYLNDDPYPQIYIERDDY